MHPAEFSIGFAKELDMTTTKRPKKKQDTSTQAIYDRFLLRFPSLPNKVEQVVYRYNPAAVRVRIIDPVFAGKTFKERELMIQDVLDTLPPGVEDDITVLLLLTPREAKDPKEIMNIEFDAPNSTM